MGIGAWEYVPGVGDVYDIGSGGAKIYTGLRDGDYGRAALGLGQAGLGALGLATFGVGSLGKSIAKGAIKSGGKYIAKHGSRMAMNKAAQQAAIKGGANPLLVKTSAYFANRPYNKAVKLAERNKNLENFINTYPFFGKGAIAPYIGVEAARLGGNYLFGVPDNMSKTGRDVTEGEGSTSNGSTSNSSGYGYSGSTIGDLSPEQQATLIQQLAQGYGGMSPGYDYGEEGRRMVSDYMLKQQAMQPYRDNLQNYIRDYQNRSDLAYNQDRELAALTGLTGNSAYTNMMGKNNALTSEAARVGLMKDYGEDLKSVGEGMDTLVGNMALAKITGLPLSAANADSKMAQLAVNKMIADNRNENRLAVEQYKGQMRLQYAQLQARLKAQLRANDRVGAANTFKQLNAFSKALNMAEKYGLTADDIYRNTGARFNIPENIGQVGDVKI